jgi:2-methylcitrate dehydratase PrpD
MAGVRVWGRVVCRATTIDAVDAHDGHVLTKGHAGVAILPALLALLDSGLASGCGRPRVHHSSW